MASGSGTMAETLRRHRFTVDDYDRMVEAGILAEDDPVELLRGEIVVTAPLGSRHAACVRRLTRVFLRLGDRAQISIQNPVCLLDSEPEPDLSLLEPRADQYASRHPGPPDVPLIVEVAESSQVLDRTVKAPLYAENGIREYWLIDLAKNTVEVYRDPGDGAYGEMREAGRGETLTPEAFPDFAVRKDEILP